MNKTVELVMEWARYEEQHPEAELSQFCQAYLTSQQSVRSEATFWHSPAPPDNLSLLTKLIGRIAKLHTLYALAAFKECGVGSFDEFLYLNSIATASNPKKTDVILANFNELSSGLLVLDRLRKAALIVEQEDESDRRTKRVFLSAEGRQVLKACYQKLEQVNQWCLSELPEQHVHSIIQALQPVEASLARQWLEDKKKS